MFASMTEDLEDFERNGSKMPSSSWCSLRSLSALSVSKSCKHMVIIQMQSRPLLKLTVWYFNVQHNCLQEERTRKSKPWATSRQTVEWWNWKNGNNARATNIALSNRCLHRCQRFEPFICTSIYVRAVWTRGDRVMMRRLLEAKPEPEKKEKPTPCHYPSW